MAHDPAKFFVCRSDDPFTPAVAKLLTPEIRVVHPQAREVHGSQMNGYPCGDTVTYQCPNCGTNFEVELPQ